MCPPWYQAGLRRSILVVVNESPKSRQVSSKVKKVKGEQPEIFSLE